jgi:hypothetical protein
MRARAGPAQDLRSVRVRRLGGHPDMPVKITDSLQATDIPNQPARNLARNRCCDWLRVCMSATQHVLLKQPKNSRFGPSDEIGDYHGDE